MEDDTNEFQPMDDVAEVFTIKEKKVKEKSSFSKRKKRNEKRKAKTDEPVSESNVDNWFFKNFGLGKLFDDGEDQPME
jgi:cell division protein FtsZ